MADMKINKKQVSHLVVLVVAMVLMANCYVSCESMNIGDVGSDQHHYHDHDDGINVTESHGLTPHYHHHNDGNRKMEVGGVIGSNSVSDPEVRGCYGGPCFFYREACLDGCICVPLFITYGICFGKCGSC
ncbi:hypothetical protein FNV43_RR02013 [Rhamnella rubrinervis]|uniref:Uncharacterized protein n=1 Tax=Rhamnella rubrinervis TaxID=2594499 RepID=A0A8K0MSK4_9ROSA|nr:hypothetical protein FNV43_RR02013 [Rhamnella rubrinervis]